jgi:hypothetical protein
MQACPHCGIALLDSPAACPACGAALVAIVDPATRPTHGIRSAPLEGRQQLAARDITRRFPQDWETMEALFPGSSAAFDRDLGEPWLLGRDGPRFDFYGEELVAFAGESVEMGHEGPWSSARYVADEVRWVIKADRRRR